MRVRHFLAKKLVESLAVERFALQQFGHELLVLLMVRD
jgi:hypothetical protein